MELTGKTTLITGAASGIGAELARAMSTAGAAVMMTDVDATAGRALADSLAANGADVAFAPLDVCSEAGWADAFGALEHWRAAGGRAPLGVLVNSAGIARRGSIEDCTLAQWQRVIDVNLTGTFLGCQWAFKAMKGHGGSIVNLSSIYGLVGGNAVAAYAASKGGVALLTKSVALHGATLSPPIRANSVHPGFVDTPMVNNARSGAEREQMLDWVREGTPLGRLAQATEIVRAIMFLGSDQSSYMTGSELVVDGGWTAR